MLSKLDNYCKGDLRGGNLHFLPPDLDSEVEQTICNSSPLEDWYINEEYGVLGFYLDLGGSSVGSASSMNCTTAVYKKDPSIMITAHSAEPGNDQFWEEWMKHLVSDKEHNSMYNVSVSKHSAEIIRLNILLLDGARAWLPLPKNSQEKPLTSDFLSIAICQILNRSNAYATGFYLRQADFEILVLFQGGIVVFSWLVSVHGEARLAGNGHSPFQEVQRCPWALTSQPEGRWRDARLLRCSA